MIIVIASSLGKTIDSYQHQERYFQFLQVQCKCLQDTQRGGQSKWKTISGIFNMKSPFALQHILTIANKKIHYTFKRSKAEFSRVQNFPTYW